MELILAVFMPAMLFVVLDLFWRRPSWLHLPAAMVGGAVDLERAERRPDEVPRQPDWDPFALPFVRRRMELMAEELTRLDRDKTIFARAFRTRVAQLAYDALLHDAERLAAVATLEMEIVSSQASLREELEI
jgi:hypothetical protein